MNKEQVLHEASVLLQDSLLLLNEKVQYFYESGAIDVDAYLSDGGTEMIGSGQLLAQILVTASMRDLVDSRMAFANDRTLSELENLKHF
jgi:hypothetical protein